MKKLISVFLLAFLAVSVFSQTATSVTNGSFLMPTTWDCMCIPTDGYIITINHDVTLDSDYMMSSGSITISSGASLVESGTGHGILFTGTAALNVQGTFTFSKLAMYGGTIANTGTMNGLDSLYLGVDFSNDGFVDAVEVSSSGNFFNNDTLFAVDYLSYMPFNNNHYAEIENFFINIGASNNGDLHLGDCYNNGHLWNQKLMIVSNDFTNAGRLDNDTLGAITIMQNCTNGDTVNNDARWTNNGAVTVYMNFQNLDSLLGDGTFCIGLNTANYGYMNGTYEFCDNSNPGTLNLNSGYIGSGITYCSTPCLSSIAETDLQPVLVFPNPASDYIHIVSVDMITDWALFDISGRVVMDCREYSDDFGIDISDLHAGLYYLRLETEDNSFMKSIIKE
ncbi:MAG: hypothetical protein C0592_05250 [Marinilabiliales bacterium]|nr:MAG: hypothetical protein C0592_05250 [Marinilabiliales bacterium]